jgi:hypothetical protein
VFAQQEGVQRRDLVDNREDADIAVHIGRVSGHFAEDIVPSPLADEEGPPAYPEVGSLEGYDNLGRVLALVVENKPLIHPHAMLQEEALVQNRCREEGLVAVVRVGTLGIGDCDQVENPTGRCCPTEGPEIAHRTVCGRLPHILAAPDARYA